MNRQAHANATDHQAVPRVSAEPSFCKSSLSGIANRGDERYGKYWYAAVVQACHYVTKELSIRQPQPAVPLRVQSSNFARRAYRPPCVRWAVVQQQYSPTAKTPASDSSPSLNGVDHPAAQQKDGRPAKYGFGTTARTTCPVHLYYCIKTRYSKEKTSKPT